MPAASRGRTTTRGLGYDYQRRRAALPPPDGEPCPFCGLEMWPEQELDADHEIPRARGGHDSQLRWAHRSCNRSAGATLGNRLRRRVRERRRSRDW